MEQNRTIHVIINPTAGNTRAIKIGRKILRKLDEQHVPYRAFYTEYPGHATELARTCSKLGVDMVLSIGGDGTAYEIAQGLINSQTALGIIPAGTGNDFIKSLQLPQSPLKCLDFILQSSARLVDVGTINGELFMNVCGTGFDVSVLDYSLKAKKYVKGMLPYLWGVLCTIMHYKPITITLRVDGEELFTKEILVCCVANGIYIGGGMAISPESLVNDGLLNIVVIENVSRTRMIRYLPGLLSGKILKFRDTTSYTGTQIQFSSPDPIRLNVDGEIIKYTDVSFGINPGSLKIYY